MSKAVCSGVLSVFEVLGLKLKASDMPSKCSALSSALRPRWDCCSCLGLAFFFFSKQGLMYPWVASNHYIAEGDLVPRILLPWSAGVTGAHSMAGPATV